MDTLDTSTSTVETSPSTESAAPEVLETSQSPEQGASTEVDQTPPAYQADYSYQVKGARKEFDEVFRPLITSKDIEDRLRDLYTARDGLDEIKLSRDQVQAQFEELQGKWNTADKNLRRFWQLKDYDLGAFFQQAQISEDQLLDYVRRKFDPEYRDNPLASESDKFRTESLTRRFQEEDLQEKLSSYERDMEELRKRNHEMELRFEMSRPEVQEFSQRFTQVYPEQTLEGLVSGYQQMMKATYQKSVTPSEALQAVMASYKPFFQMTPPQPQVAAPAQPKAPPPPPNLGTPSETSPIKKAKFESLDELRNYRKALQG